MPGIIFGKGYSLCGLITALILASCVLLIPVKETLADHCDPENYDDYSCHAACLLYPYTIPTGCTNNNDGFYCYEDYDVQYRDDGSCYQIPRQNPSSSISGVGWHCDYNPGVCYVEPTTPADPPPPECTPTYFTKDEACFGKEYCYDTYFRNEDCNETYISETCRYDRTCDIAPEPEPPPAPQEPVYQPPTYTAPSCYYDSFSGEDHCEGEYMVYNDVYMDESTGCEWRPKTPPSHRVYTPYVCKVEEDQPPSENQCADETSKIPTNTCVNGQRVYNDFYKNQKTGCNTWRSQDPPTHLEDDDFCKVASSQPAPVDYSADQCAYKENEPVRRGCNEENQLCYDIFVTNTDCSQTYGRSDCQVSKECEPGAQPIGDIQGPVLQSIRFQEPVISQVGEGDIPAGEVGEADSGGEDAGVVTEADIGCEPLLEQQTSCKDGSRCVADFKAIKNSEGVCEYQSDEINRKCNADLSCPAQKPAETAASDQSLAQAQVCTIKPRSQQISCSDGKRCFSDYDVGKDEEGNCVYVSRVNADGKTTHCDDDDKCSAQKPSIDQPADNQSAIDSCPIKPGLVQISCKDAMRCFSYMDVKKDAEGVCTHEPKDTETITCEEDPSCPLDQPPDLNRYSREKIEAQLAQEQGKKEESKPSTGGGNPLEAAGNFFTGAGKFIGDFTTEHIGSLSQISPTTGVYYKSQDCSKIPDPSELENPGALERSVAFYCRDQRNFANGVSAYKNSWGDSLAQQDEEFAKRQSPECQEEMLGAFAQRQESPELSIRNQPPDPLKCGNISGPADDGTDYFIKVKRKTDLGIAEAERTGNAYEAIKSITKTDLKDPQGQGASYDPRTPKDADQIGNRVVTNAKILEAAAKLGLDLDSDPRDWDADKRKVFFSLVAQTEELPGAGFTTLLIMMPVESLVEQEVAKKNCEEDLGNLCLLRVNDPGAFEKLNPEDEQKLFLASRDQYGPEFEPAPLDLVKRYREILDAKIRRNQASYDTGITEDISHEALAEDLGISVNEVKDIETTIRVYEDVVKGINDNSASAEELKHAQNEVAIGTAIGIAVWVIDPVGLGKGVFRAVGGSVKLTKAAVGKLGAKLGEAEAAKVVTSAEQALAKTAAGKPITKAEAEALGSLKTVVEEEGESAGRAGLSGVFDEGSAPLGRSVQDEALEAAVASEAQRLQAAALAEQARVPAQEALERASNGVTAGEAARAGDSAVVIHPEGARPIAPGGNALSEGVEQLTTLGNPLRPAAHEPVPLAVGPQTPASVLDSAPLPRDDYFRPGAPKAEPKPPPAIEPEIPPQAVIAARLDNTDGVLAKEAEQVALAAERAKPNPIVVAVEDTKTTIAQAVDDIDQAAKDIAQGRFPERGGRVDPCDLPLVAFNNTEGVAEPISLVQSNSISTVLGVQIAATPCNPNQAALHAVEAAKTKYDAAVQALKKAEAEKNLHLPRTVEWNDARIEQTARATEVEQAREVLYKAVADADALGALPPLVLPPGALIPGSNPGAVTHLPAPAPGVPVTPLAVEVLSQSKLPSTSFGTSWLTPIQNLGKNIRENPVLAATTLVGLPTLAIIAGYFQLRGDDQSPPPATVQVTPTSTSVAGQPTRTAIPPTPTLTPPTQTPTQVAGPLAPAAPQPAAAPPAALTQTTTGPVVPPVPQPAQNIYVEIPRAEKDDKIVTTSGCWGDHSAIVKVHLRDDKMVFQELVSDYGIVPGECGNPQPSECAKGNTIPPITYTFHKLKFG